MGQTRPIPPTQQLRPMSIGRPFRTQHRCLQDRTARTVLTEQLSEGDGHPPVSLSQLLAASLPGWLFSSSSHGWVIEHGYAVKRNG